MTSVGCSVAVARMLGMTPTTVAMIASLDLRDGFVTHPKSRRPFVIAHVREAGNFTGMWLWPCQNLPLTADDVGVYPDK